MKTLTVNIDNEKDLSVLEEILMRFGLSYHIKHEYNFTEQEIKSLLKTKHEFLEGNNTAKNWAEVEQDLNNAFG